MVDGGCLQLGGVLIVADCFGRSFRETVVFNLFDIKMINHRNEMECIKIMICFRSLIYLTCVWYSKCSLKGQQGGMVLGRDIQVC